jgi:hypothetical protein
MTKIVDKMTKDLDLRVYYRRLHGEDREFLRDFIECLFK